MGTVSEMSVPGLGVRFEFETSTGTRLGVFHRHGGRQELLIFDPEDPDTCLQSVPLEDEDARTLAELLGGAGVAQELARLRQRIEGIAIDWLPLSPESPFAGRTIGDTGARTRTGVSIVAIMREDGAVPAPGPDQVLRGGDTLVVVGTPRGIEELVIILRQG